MLGRVFESMPKGTREIGQRRGAANRFEQQIACGVVTLLNRCRAKAGVEALLYDRVRVEPTDLSFRDAIRFAEAHPVDGIVAVGGGSVIDTAKAVNLYTTYPPADFLDYVNAPIGKAMPVPGPRLHEGDGFKHGDYSLGLFHHGPARLR